VIIAGATIGTCCSMPTLSMLNDGYQVFPVVDACAAWNEYEAQAAIARMTGAGAEPVCVCSPWMTKPSSGSSSVKGLIRLKLTPEWSQD